MEAEISANTQRRPMRLTPPSEQGGPIARRGFRYQDEITTGFLIEMLDESGIEEVHCETLDDIVLLCKTPSGAIAEFIQVKTGDAAPRSIADLCARTGTQGSSIIEKSLSRDRIAETTRFRLVTTAPVAKHLECLTRSREGRRSDDGAYLELARTLQDRLPGVRSPNGNDFSYWVENCFWEVRAAHSDIRNANHALMSRLATKRGRALDAYAIETLLDDLRNRARAAAEASIEIGISAKAIVRSVLQEWWEARTSELTSLSQLVARVGLESQVAPIAAKIAVSNEAVDKKAFHYLKRSLRWSYIVEGADTSRSLYAVLWPILVEPATTPRLICIIGEPLSGKSTLMWRFGYDLHLHGRNVLQVSDVDKSLWGRLAALTNQSTQDVVLLVDDIFEDERITGALLRFFESATSAASHVTILATAISDNHAMQALADLRREGVSVWNEHVILTATDKEAFLRDTSYDKAAYPTFWDDRNLARIDKFHTLAATVREIDEGNLRIEEISAGFVPETLEARRLERLRNNQPRLWSAYKYVAFCFRFKIAIPLSVLMRLEDFNFYDIEELEGADAYLSLYDSFPSGRGITTLRYRVITSQHWKLAETHWRTYVQFESPVKLLRSILQSVDVNDSWHAGFVTHLIRAIASERSIPWREIIPDYLDRLRRLQRSLPVEHLAIWRSIYTSLELTDEAKRCAQATREQVPADATDAIVQIRLFERQDKDLWKAYEAIKRALERWPDNENVEEIYVTFIGQHRLMFQNDVRSLLDRLKDFLADAGEHWNRVASYVQNIVIPAGEPSHHRQAESAIRSWLEANNDHPKTPGLWVTYLSLVQKKLPLAFPRASRRCVDWLSTHRAHAGYAHLAHAYATQVAKSHDKRALDGAMIELLGWLSDHPLNAHLWDCCLQLSRNPLAEEPHVRRVIEVLLGGIGSDDFDEEGALINRINSAGTIVSLLSLFEDRYRQPDGSINSDELHLLAARVNKWLGVHHEDAHARRRFIDFVCAFGNADHRRIVIEETNQWLRAHQSNQQVIGAYRRLVERHSAASKKNPMPDATSSI
jgi:tetratricopeptide (TPR) repeat protein